MIEINVVIIIHKILIDKYGGSNGVRDMGLLESAIHRPCSTFGNQELYPTPEEKASSLIESFLINHPFIDGNKRIGYVLMRLILLMHGKDIEADEDEKYDFVIGIASGTIKYESILKWVKDRIRIKK